MLQTMRTIVRWHFQDNVFMHVLHFLSDESYFLFHKQDLASHVLCVGKSYFTESTYEDASMKLDRV